MAHEQCRGEIGEDPARRKEKPHDIHRQIRVNVKQFAERDAWMRLDMSQRQRFLLQVWGNLMGPKLHMLTFKLEGAVYFGAGIASGHILSPPAHAANGRRKANGRDERLGF